MSALFKFISITKLFTPINNMEGFYLMKTRHMYEQQRLAKDKTEMK